MGIASQATKEGEDAEVGSLAKSRFLTAASRRFGMTSVEGGCDAGLKPRSSTKTFAGRSARATHQRPTRCCGPMNLDRRTAEGGCPHMALAGFKARVTRKGGKMPQI